MGLSGDFYFLVAGRWFKAATLDGPWTFATPTLPPDFKQISVEHPRSRVLASVPGTRQATEAVLLASIPRTARVNKKELKAPDVVYQGEPQFKPIDGSKGVQQAVNTDKDIVKYGDLYYMCFQGVWFMSRAATGPWEVASSIPQEVYTIPASSPVHHVTYVTVEDDDDNDEWVTFAYVAAYTGLMIGWGCAVWGSGWYYPPYYGYGGFYYPYPHTYGMGAWYNPHTGAYGRGYAAYGPYGGVGMGASTTRERGPTRAAPRPTVLTDRAPRARPITRAPEPTRKRDRARTSTATGARVRCSAAIAGRRPRIARTIVPARPRRAFAPASGGGAVSRTGPGGDRTHRRPHGQRRCVCRPRRERVSPHDSGGWEQNSGSGWDSVDWPAPTGAATRERPASAGTSQTGQLERDRTARTEGNQRTTNRSSWQSSGATRAGAGSYGGGGARAGGGGGRRR